MSERTTAVGHVFNFLLLKIPAKIKVHRILRTINKVESSKAFVETEELLKEGAQLMGEAISKDKRFADELDEESRTRGGRQARAVVLDPIASEHSMKHWQTIELNEKRYLDTFATWFNSDGMKWLDVKGIKLSEIKDEAALNQAFGGLVEEFMKVQTENLTDEYGEGHWAQLFAASYREFADEMRPYLLKSLADEFAQKQIP